MSFAQFWQSQIPLLELARAAGDIAASNRGPCVAAAEMCAATPTLIDFSGSNCGPSVGARQSGREHRYATRRPRFRFTLSGKSSRIAAMIPDDLVYSARRANGFKLTGLEPHAEW
jgi:hypothetical protein